jgi:hypothetical protein
MAAGAAASCVTIIVVLLEWGQISRIGGEIAPTLLSRPAKPGSVGLVVSQTAAMPEGLRFNPYYWSGVHYLRRSQAILANAPWMNLPILMMRPVHPDRWAYQDPTSASRELVARMRSGLAVPDLDYVVEDGEPDIVVDAAMHAAGWSTVSTESESVNIYRRKP